MITNGKRRSSLILFLLIASLPIFAQDWQKFDDYVNKGLKDFEVPGCAVAVVRNDSVIFAKGYGVRELGKPELVTTKTLFAIASCTKAFTAATLAILADEGKIKWDDPVTKYLKDFQLYDPYVTREITVRDLLCHRSGLGLGAGDLLWYGSDLSREDVLHRLRYFKPASSFRSAYAYQNNMFLAAGQIVQVASGKSWEDFVKSRIFVPLSMNESNTSISEIRPNQDFATPHAKIDGKVNPIPYRNVDNCAPAGGINSNVEEMASWVRLQLAEGMYLGYRVFSTEAAREMWSAQTVRPVGTPQKPLESLQPKFFAYGLGWGIRDFHGRKMLGHSGGLDGMISQITLVPEEKVGVVVLTNQEESLAYALSFKLVDMLLGATPETDWCEKYLEVRADNLRKRNDEEKKIEELHVKGTKPSLPLAKYAATYEDDAYGQAVVSEQDGRLVLRLTHTPGAIGTLDHWHYDTFVGTWDDKVFPKVFVTFTLNAKGEVDEMKIANVSSFADFSFDWQDFHFKRKMEEKQLSGK